MQDLPHQYTVTATAGRDSNVQLASAGVDNIESAPPTEFGGPGDRWSPESLLVAAVADCFVLSFRAIARGMKLDWLDLSCEAEGVLDRVDKVTRFTEIRLRAVLDVPAGTDEQKATRIMQKAEHACLISNSLNAEVRLETTVRGA